jgi:rhamnosyltransferase
MEEEGQAMKILVVIYNKSLSQSQAISSISGIEGLEVFVADNSTADYGNKAYALQKGYHYFDMGGNAGLSKAYNRVISTLEKNDEVICLFDDDTTIDSTYFDALRESADKYMDINIFAPVIKDRKGMLSPCVFNGIRGKRVKRLEQIPPHGISIVNSGLAIRLRVFRDYLYDEGLFLDYIDHAFIRDVIGNDRAKVQILNVTLRHCFSGSELTSKEDIINRYGIFKKDFRYFCSKYGVSPIRSRIFLLARSVRIMIKNML